MQVPGRKRIIWILVEKVEWNDQLCQMRGLNHNASSRYVALINCTDYTIIIQLVPVQQFRYSVAGGTG